jgi:tRNA-specific 2-thiouridylase
LYVVGIDAEQRTVTVGPRQALERVTLDAAGVNWIAGTPPPSGTRVTAQIRYRHREAAASLDPGPDDTVRVTFEEPQYAVAPGQAVVFYDGDSVVGGGWIC